MRCDEARIGLYALLDGELDVATNVEVLAHVEACPSCQWECELDSRLKALVHDDARRRAVAPPDLWPAITGAIRQEASGDEVSGPRARPQLGALWRRPLARPAAVAAMVLVVAMAVVGYLRTPWVPSFVVEEIVTDHLGSVLRPQGPVDVASGDAAVVADTLRQHLSFEAQVLALTDEGMRLLGGSVCNLRSTRGIRLTYALDRDRTLSFYQLERPPTTAFPRPGARPVYVGTVDPQRGPGTVLWADERFLFALVAELPPERLEQLAARF
jgi:anti-sigma factor RsiW